MNEFFRVQCNLREFTVDTLPSSVKFQGSSLKFTPIEGLISARNSASEINQNNMNQKKIIKEVLKTLKAYMEFERTNMRPNAWYRTRAGKLHTKRYIYLQRAFLSLSKVK